jgi:hypothetical protein
MVTIIEKILEQKKKYIILLSGLLWWDYFNYIVKILADNLGFELIYVYSLLPDDKLISSADHINFPALNEIIQDRLKKYTNVGYIIVSYTFPPEKIEFYPDFHINININPLLLTNITIEFVKSSNISRLDIDNHINYLFKSWKTNKINKTIIYHQDFIEKENLLYGYIFDAIMENIEKKLYGENFDKIKENIKIDPFTTKHDYIKISDPTKLNNKDKLIIHQGKQFGSLISGLDDAIDDAKKESDALKFNVSDKSEDSDNSEESDELEDSDETDELKDEKNNVSDSYKDHSDNSYNSDNKNKSELKDEKNNVSDSYKDHSDNSYNSDNKNNVSDLYKDQSNKSELIIISNNKNEKKNEIDQFDKSYDFELKDKLKKENKLTIKKQKHLNLTNISSKLDTITRTLDHKIKKENNIFKLNNSLIS